MRTPAPPPPPRSNALFLTCLALIVLAFGLRYGSMPLSLWYDEIYTVLTYTFAPWKTAFTAYSPNNHLLSTLLIKLSSDTLQFLGIVPPPEQIVAGEYSFFHLTNFEPFRFRLPSLMAGAILPVALAWPLLAPRDQGVNRITLPFLTIALVAIFSPWLISFSIEARGYALLLLFAVAATHYFDQLAARKGFIVYSLFLAAALLTIPIAVVILAAHGVLAMFRGRDFFIKRFFPAAAIAVLFTTAVYAPMLPQIQHAASRMLNHHTPFADLLASIARALLLGFDDRHLSTPATVAIVLIVPLLLCAGFAAAWKKLPALRTTLLTLALSAALTLVAAALYPPVREDRFNAWLAPLFAIAIAALVLTLLPASGRFFPLARRTTLFLGGSLVAGALLVAADLRIAETPAQPWVEAFQYTQALVGEGSLAVIHTGSLESTLLYYPLLARTRMISLYTLPAFQQNEARAPAPEFVILGYTRSLQRDDPAFFDYLRSHYFLLRTLPARVDDTTIWKRK